MADAWLILDDGFSLPGTSFGARLPSLDQLDLSVGEVAPRALGEVVFVTAMSGYHELLTDPSYTGQIVTMTHPHVGNYGCDDAWSEAGERGRERTVSPAGLICRKLYTGPVPDGRVTLSEYLRSHSTPGITDVDTRQLTLHLRDYGARNGLLLRGEGNSLTETETKRSLEILTRFPPMLGRDLVRAAGAHRGTEINPAGSPHIAILDCGAKQNIVRLLLASGCRVTVMAASTTAKQLEAIGPDALLVSNGPGDPAALDPQVSLIRRMIGRIPVLGICLGHQLIARALGASTFKMPFGHHGLNHPVRDRRTGRVFVTSQNHGFAVEGSSLPSGCKIWFDNVNDGTVEGIIDDRRRVRTTQFHPEAAPGPHDAAWIFESFLEIVPPHLGGKNAGTP